MVDVMRLFFCVMFFFVVVLSCSEVWAAGLPQTRYVYTEQTGPASVRIVNPDKHDVLVQVYLDSGVAQGKVSVFPSVFTMGPNSSRVVKIYGLNSWLSKDMETIRSIKVATVKAEADRGAVDIVVVAQYKMLLRPKIMSDLTLEEAVAGLAIDCERSGCFLANASQFNIIFSSIVVDGKPINVEWIEPRGRVYIGKVRPKSIVGKYIDDAGYIIVLPDIAGVAMVGR